MELAENGLIRNKLNVYSDKLFFNIVEMYDALSQLTDKIKGFDDLDTKAAFLVRTKQLEFLDFSAYTRAKMIPFFFSISDQLENLEKEVDSLLLQIKDLRSTIKKSRKISIKRDSSIKKEKLKSSLEGKKEETSLVVSKDFETELLADDAEYAPVTEGGTTVGLEELSVITEYLNSQGGEALKSKFAELVESPTDIEALERGATIFIQPIEDGYTIYIQNKIKGRHREVLESIYAAQPPSIRFETLQSLIERCGGMLRFDGRGSSHFHNTLPGGYTGRSWRLHGGAHSLKIQHRALEDFRNAFSGVARILGIEHAIQR